LENSELKKIGAEKIGYRPDEGGFERDRENQWHKRRGFRISILAAAFLALNLSIYLEADHLIENEAQREVIDQWAENFTGLIADARGNQTPSPAPAEDDSLFGQIFGSQPEPGGTRESWSTRVVGALVSFVIAALLAAALAFRPRKNLSLLRRNPFIAQTQILLAVVGAAMMMVVADNVARAFGIFAAATMIRFRTNIRDPKEITILLVCLAIGLASGVRHWEIAAALTLFVLLILWPLERYELSQVFRAMEFEVKTYDLDRTDAVLKKIFGKYGINAELRKIDPEAKESLPSTILYYLTLSPDISTDRLSGEIFSSDSQNIDSMQWQQKKSNSYIYR
jgi:uncharacterized membrane protein YhiD involved in acid resistance